MMSRLMLITIILMLATKSFSVIIDSVALSESPCKYLWDIKIQNRSVYAPPKAPPAPANLSVDADINIPVRLHVFLEHGPQSVGTINGIDNWITDQQQSIHQSASLSLIGVNVVKDIRFILYFPTLFNSTTNKTNLYASYRNLNSITFLNESEWKKLALDTFTIPPDNQSINLATNQFCSEAAVEILLNASTNMQYQLFDTSCPANFGQHCPKHYWERLCTDRLRRTDIFKFNYTHGNITVKLLDSSGLELFQSNKTVDNFTLPDNGGYSIRIESPHPANITYGMMYKCKDIRAYNDHLMKLDINTTDVNVFLTNVRIKPVIYGRYEFITQSPIKSGTLMMIKWLDSSRVLDYFWQYLAEAFGAEIQKKNESPPCEQRRTRLDNDTIIALYQPKKLRCNLYNSKDPFGKNFNRTKINITMADGKITTLYIPSSKVLGSNHSLYCDEAKLCVWVITPSKTNRPSLIPITSTTATSMEQCFVGDKWCERRTSSVLATTKSITTSVELGTTNIIVLKSSVISRPTMTPNTKSFITEAKIIFGFFDDVSSLNYQDIEQWVWINAKTTVTHSCIHKRSIKLTIKINDINRLSRDLVSVQYQLRNGRLYLQGYQVCIMNVVNSYDCDEKVENLCHPRKFRLKTWHIISFAFSGVLWIINVILAIWLLIIWRC